MASQLPDEEPTFFPEARGFRAWLAGHHDSTDHIWVGYYKKAAGKPSVTWDDTVTEALCYGWIDGIRRSRDHESYMIRFTPRNPNSVWSGRNIDLMEQLIEEGKVAPAGLAAFAHKDAHPDSGYRVGDLGEELPPEMIAQFKRTSSAWQFYQAQPNGYRGAAARWVLAAKREDTRQRRLATLIDDSHNERRIKQLRRT